MEGLKN
jgi:hypothetical protein